MQVGNIAPARKETEIITRISRIDITLSTNHAPIFDSYGNYNMSALTTILLARMKQQYPEAGISVTATRNATNDQIEVITTPNLNFEMEDKCKTFFWDTLLDILKNPLTY